MIHCIEELLQVNVYNPIVAIIHHMRGSAVLRSLNRQSCTAFIDMKIK